MVQNVPAAFFSYSRDDSDFALRLAEDLKAAGASVWLDQLDIVPGERWDRAVEDALAHCPCMLVILSPASINSTNVMDEVSFALDEKKTVIPVIYKNCAVPLRLRRVQFVDFRQDYGRGVKELLKALAPEQKKGQITPAIRNVQSQRWTDITEMDERQRANDLKQRKAGDHQQAERGRVDQELNPVTEQLGLKHEDKRAAEQAGGENEVVLRDGFRLRDWVSQPCNLPYASLGRLLKGRERVLSEVYERLKQNPGRALVIHAQAGVGKTRLTIEYAWRHEAEYSALLMAGADSPNALKRNLAALCSAQLLNLPQREAKEQEVKVAGALRWLDEHHGWLLILDNANTYDAAEAVEALLPQLRAGHVVVTPV